MPRIQCLGIAAVMAAVMLVGGAPAFATEPLTPSSYVTDSDSFLSDEQRAKIETDAESFSSKYHPIYAVTVPNFSDEEPTEWCQATLNNIQNNNKALLYVVGYEDGKDAYCVGPELERSMRISYANEYVRSALSQARQKYTSTPLTPDEAAAGLTTFISSLRSSYATYDRQSYAPHSQTNANYEAERQERKASERLESIKNIVLFFFLGILVIGSIIFGEWSKAREEEARAIEIEEAAWRVSRSRDAREDEAARRDADKAAQQANDRLSQADQEVRDAEKEWDYARAQFGIAATEQFRNRIKEAKQALSRGDSLLKQCRTAYDPAKKESLASQIINELDTQLGLLRDAQAPFSTKRSERTALPTRLAEAQERLAEELADVERSREELATIASIYPGTVLAALEDNPDKAASLLTSARSAIESAQAIIDTDTELATSAVDTAERALLMAYHEMNAIFTAKQDLDHIEDRLGAAIASLSSDIEEADRLQTDRTLLAPLITDARAAITRAQEALIHNDNPLDALEHARSVEAKLDATLDPLRSRGR
jgi:uncharacterized membrane protein YgcG